MAESNTLLRVQANLPCQQEPNMQGLKQGRRYLSLPDLAVQWQVCGLAWLGGSVP